MKTSKVYFISGIDTDCGKTYVTGLLAARFKEKGCKVITQKPVQTGCREFSDDILSHRKAMGTGFLEADKQGITCSYLFEKPASPHLAARIESRPIDVSVINCHTKQLKADYDIVLIEGAGGLMVPFTDNMLTIDYVKDNNYPLILVSNNKLGSINHTLLSIEACINRGINLHTLIYNRFDGEDKMVSDDSLDVIKHYLACNLPTTIVVDFGSISDFEKMV